MNPKLKTIIVLAGLALSLIALILIYRDFAINQVRVLPISLFGVGVISSYKVLVKTNHTSRKFNLNELDDEDN
ncbi:hypothetical protein OAN33_07080 [Flavobacteriales bacterium]|nr:hypothetical protein [Flavobacteriales bacterium]